MRRCSGRLYLLVCALAAGACDRTENPAAESPSPAVVRTSGISALNLYTGIPFGPAALWNSSTVKWGPAPFTSSVTPTVPSAIVTLIDAARRINQKLILNMTGGSHERYKTDGKFDLAKWKAVMNTFDRPEIKAAVAAGVADGTIVMANMMDEPSINDWGGVMTKGLIDEMATYVDGIFPTVPTGVGVRHNWRLHERYQVIDAILTQFSWRKGDATAYRDSALRMAQQDGISVIFSMNILDGGVVNYKTKANWECPVPLTGGRGTRSPTCRMTPNQVREWGRILGSAGCAMSMWRYDQDFLADPANRQAVEDVAATLAAIPGRPCRRDAQAPPPPPPPPPANTPPTAAFEAPRCRAGVACQFTDDSDDDDGSIATRSWEFGNGETSTERNPSTTFAETGDYDVTLTVTDDYEATNSVTQRVTVGSATNAPPTAAFDAPSCTAGVACQFNDDSDDDDGSIATRSWEFGNGETSTERNPSTTFAEAGDYNVTLTVTDDEEATSSVTRSVTVGAAANAPPTAAFDPPSCTAGVACQFNDHSSDDDGSIATRRWEFGNGATSTGTNPATTFAAAGNYSVTLTVTDDDEAHNSVTKTVTVALVPAPATIALSLTGSVKNGRQIVLLTWSGATGSSVDLYRDDVRILTTANDGKQNNAIPVRGNSTYTYQVCESGTSRCSARATFTLPSILLDVTAWMKEVDLQAMTLRWAGAGGATVNVYRNGVVIKNTANTGRYVSTRRFRGAATYVLKVCETATSRCSNTVTATFK